MAARRDEEVTVQEITPCLWFDDEGEAAAELSTSLVPGSSIDGITRYGSAGSGPEGAVMTVSFTLAGRPFLALNGGPRYPFTEAVSFQVSCETQEEVDRLWSRLSDGGEEGPCGWVKDRFGLSWQIVPSVLPRLLGGPGREAAQRVMAAMLQMGKLDIDGLERAAAAV